jgi:uncharacterized protein (DUF2126 family)
MLPHFVQQDFFAVLAHARQSGFVLNPEWFNSHFEFRFPKIGSICADGLEVELCRALEPWNVLAEEAAAGRTVRSVDSSVERLQVKMSGHAADSRYIVACNGRRVPLQSAAELGVSVAGVRFRARKLSATMHPTIPVHSPLTFTLIDLRDGRSIGQCTYRVDPPEDRKYEHRPESASEAEARRLERFSMINPIVPVAVPEEEINPIFPGTLDLRIPSRSASARIETREILL